MSVARSPAAGGRKSSATRGKSRTAAKKAASKKPVAKKRKKAAAKAGKKSPARAKPVTRKRVRSAGSMAPHPAAPRDTAPGLSALRYKEAVDAYSRGMALLQKKNWEAASRAFADFLSQFSQERELAERARMYLRICGQHLDTQSATPKDFEDRYYLAVVLSNQGKQDSALGSIDKALAERPRSRKAHYLKASILALMGNRRAALDALAAAIELDEQSRIYAANDPDFSGLRDDEEFITLTTREDDEEA